MIELTDDVIAEVAARRLLGFDSWTWQIWPTVVAGLSTHALRDLLDRVNPGYSSDPVVDFIILGELARRV